MASKGSNKHYLQLGEEYRDNIRKATPVDTTETYAQQQERIKRLEANPEEWFKYYFPNFAYAEPAPFHKRSTKAVLAHPEYYIVRAWSRELSKSTRTMMEVLYLTLTKQKKNVILVSNSYDNAVRLLLPYKSILENNALS